MMDQAFRLDFETFNHAVLRHRWKILVAGIAAAAIAFGISLVQKPSYDATAQLLFQSNDYAQTLFGSSLQSSAAAADPSREAATDLALASLETVAARAKQDLHSRLSLPALRSRVSVSPAGQADIVDVTASASTPVQAARIANAFAQEVVTTRREGEQQQIQNAITSLEATPLKITSLQATPLASRPVPQGGRSLGSELSQLEVLKQLQTGDVELVQPATPPTSPAAPRRLEETLAGAVAGVLLAVIAALVLYRVDPRVRSEEDLCDLLQAAVLTRVPNDRALRKGVSSSSVDVLEAFHFLRLNLQLQVTSEGARIIAVMSALPQEGKTTVASRLACAFAASGVTTGAADFDLRRPGLHEQFGFEPSRGVSDILTGRGGVDDFARSRAGVSVVPAGRVAIPPAVAIGVSRLPSVLADLRRRSEYVVLDTPPIIVAAEASSIAATADGVILVVDLSRTRRQTLIHVRRQLTSVDAKLLGIVVNRAQRDTSDYGYGAYGNAEQSAADEMPQRVEEETDDPSPSNGARTLSEQTLARDAVSVDDVEDTSL